MKTWFLSAALVVSCGAAQPALPATPPASPAPAASPPAPTVSAPNATTPVLNLPVLNLSAPVGAATEWLTTTTSRVSVSDVKVVALPGAKVTEAELNKLRRDLSASAGQIGQTLTLSGKAFFRVTGRTADGRVTLVSTVVQQLPGEAPVTLRFTQQVARDGQVSGLNFESDHPTMNAVFANLAPEKLAQFASENGSDFQGVYGRPLVPGDSRRESLSIDAEGLLGSVLGALATEANADALFDQVQATPLMVTTTTTYQGLNPQGLHAFTQSSTYGDWTVTAGGQGDLPTIKVRLGQVQAAGTQTYRRDGLPGPSTQSVNMTMQMSLTLDGVQVSMTMTIDQRSAMTAKP